MREIIDDLLLHSKYLKQKEYWTDKLSPGYAGTGLLPHCKRKQEPQKNIEKIEFLITGKLYDKLVKLGKNSDLSIYIIFLTALNILIYRYTNQKDIVVVSPVYKQNMSEDIFNDRVFIHEEMDDDMPFIELLLKIRKSVLEAYENQDYPFDKLLGYLFHLTPDRIDKSMSDMSNIVCLLKNIHDDIKAVEDWKDKLVFSFIKNEKQVKGHILYDANIYENDYLKRAVVHFVKILEKSFEDIKIKVSTMTFYTEEEKQQLIFDFNNTASEYPKAKTLHQLFQEQVNQTPNHIAVMGTPSHNVKAEAIRQLPRQVTYLKLNETSNQLARILRKKGIIPDVIVGIMMERSIEMLVGMLGILKAGGAYLPINSETSENRANFILEDSRIPVLLTSAAIAFIPRKKDINKTYARELILLDELTGLLSQEPGENLDNVNQSSDLAYTIYTSGSTGKPKGIMIEHRSVNNLVSGLKERIYKNYRNHLRVSLVAPFEFDASVQQIFGALLQGHHLHIVPENARLDGTRLLDFYKKYQIHISDGTPTHIRMLLESMDGNKVSLDMNHFIIAGEAFPVKIAEHFLNRFERPLPNISNLYGPTETCVDSTIYHISKEELNDLDILPIGKSLPNQQVYILDKKNQLHPIGVAGELCIGGDGVARGYLNNPELTAEKFDHDLKDYRDYHDGNHRSYRSYKSYIIYKTGDLARWLPDGNIEFLGRMDHQVKLRGFRIELGEIEHVLVKYKEIKDALVIKREIKDEPYLCAYIVPVKKPDLSKLRYYLSGELPDYMLPSYFVQIDRIPLTANGKLNIKALPEPEIGVDGGSGEYEAPGNQLEEKLVEIWAGVLGIEKHKIGINDKFLELGGHSLKAVKLIAEIHKKFNIRIPLQKIFDLNTVKALAGYIGEAVNDEYVQIESVESDIFNNLTIKKQAEILKKYGRDEYISIPSAEEKDYYAVSSAQKRLFILQQMELNAVSYNILEVVELEGGIDIDRFKKVCRKIIARHESLRTSFELIEGEPAQRIRPNVEFEIEYYEKTTGDQWFLVSSNGVFIDNRDSANGKNHGWLTNKGSMGETPSSIKAQPFTNISRIIDRFVRPFDLSKSPLLRVGLIDKGEEKPSHILMVDMHHIISDGTSMAILIKEFMAYYQGKELPPLRIQYKDYSQWQNRLLGSHELKKQEKYWLEVFAGEIPVMNNLIDYPRSSAQDSEGNSILIKIDKELTHQLREMTKKTGTTTYMILHAVYNILLSKYTGEENIVVGLGIAGRTHADLENIIGMFVNMLPMRNRLKENKKFSEFLEDVKKNTLNAFENQDYPFDRLVMELGVQREYGRNPLFDTQFTFQNMEVQPLVIPGLSLKPYKYRRRTRQFDLSLNGMENGEIITLMFSYKKSLFKRATLGKLGKHYTEILEQVIKNQHINLKDIRISQVLVTAQSGLSRKDALGFEF